MTFSSHRHFIQRVLYEGLARLEIELTKPEQIEIDLWELELRLRFPERTLAETIVATDGIDCLLNAMQYVRGILEEDPRKWVRFPGTEDDWHWFPAIPPCHGRDFDQIVSKVIYDEQTKYCRRKQDF